MLKTVVLLLFFFFFKCDTVYFSGFFDESKVQKSRMYLKQIVCNIINVFTATFDQFNASLLNKSIIIITI